MFFFKKMMKKLFFCLIINNYQTKMGSTLSNIKTTEQNKEYELSYTDNNSPYYKKLKVTYTKSDTFISIEASPIESFLSKLSSSVVITCSSHSNVYKGYVVRTDHYFSAFGHRCDEEKVLLSNFIKKYTSDAEYDMIKHDSVERWIKSNEDNKYYELFYKPSKDRIMIQRGKQYDEMIYSNESNILYMNDYYPNDINKEIRSMVQTFHLKK